MKNEERHQQERSLWLWERLWRGSPQDDVLESWRANLAMAVAVAILLITFLTLAFIILGWLRGRMTLESVKVMVLATLFSIPLYGWVFWRLRKGVSTRTLLFLLAVIYVGIGSIVLKWGGIHSPAWLFFIWAVMVTGMLLGPKWVIRALLSVGAYFVLMSILSFHFPQSFPVPADRQSFIDLFIVLLFLMVALLTYIDASSKEYVVQELLQLKRSLEESQASLEARVRERTELLSERARQLEIIADLNRSMIGSTSLSSLCSTIVDMLSERLDFYHVGIFLLDDSGEWLRLYAASSEGGKQMLARGHKLKMGTEGMVGYVGVTRRPRIASDVGEDATWFNNPDLPETRSEMALPLVSSDDLLGVLDIQSRRANAFTDEDVETLSILADALSVAISNARVMERYLDALERLERYRSEDVIAGWRRALNRRRRSVAMLYDRIAVREFSDEERTAMNWEREVQGVSEVTVQEHEHGFDLLAPLRIRSMTVGVLRFESPRRWSRDEIELVRALVEHISLALENARLLEESRFRAEQEAARSEIVARIRASVQVDTILRSAARELGRALAVDRVRVQLLPPAFREEESGEA